MPSPVTSPSTTEPRLWRETKWKLRWFGNMTWYRKKWKHEISPEHNRLTVGKEMHDCFFYIYVSRIFSCMQEEEFLIIQKHSLKGKKIWKKNIFMLCQKGPVNCCPYSFIKILLAFNCTYISFVFVFTIYSFMQYSFFFY